MGSELIAVVRLTEHDAVIAVVILLIVALIILLRRES